MHPRNKLRLLAGLTIDPSLELAEAREVPNRKNVQPANEANLKKKQASINKACQHLRNAVKALEAAPATDTSADIPQMIKEIEDLCTDLENMSTSIELKESHIDKDHDKKVKCKKSGRTATIVSSGPGEGPNEEYKVKTPDGKIHTKKAKELVDESEFGKELAPTTSQQFKDGDVVIYDDGIFVVVLSDAQADMVGIIPAGMANASAEEKNRSVEMVKPDKLRKPTEEEMSVMKQSPEQRASIDDDMDVQFSMESYTPHEHRDQSPFMLPEVRDAIRAEGVDPRKAKLIAANEYEFKNIYSAPDYPHPPHKVTRNLYRLGDTNVFVARVAERVNESTLNFDPNSNAVSHENEESDPINVVGQGEKQWANSLDPKTVKSEIPTQLDNRGDGSMDDYEAKIKVPARVKKDLRDAINTFRKEAERQPSGHTGTENKQLYMDTADAFERLLGCLEGGTLEHLKKAQIFASSLMGPMLHKIPDTVWDFLVNGGQKRSLKDYVIKIGEK